jgi:hypothetical protein
VAALAPLLHPVGELVETVGEDLAEAVVGLDIAELLVGRAVGALGLGGRPGGLAGSALGALASYPGLIAELTLETGQPLLDVRAGRGGWGGGRDRGAAPQARDLPVGLLDLLEPPRGLDRAAVVVGVVLLDEAPVGGPKFLVGDARLYPEDGVGVAAQGTQTQGRGRGPLGRPVGQRPYGYGGRR